jgi:hypothetical protein
MQQPFEFYLSNTSHGGDRLDTSPQLICMAWKDGEDVVRIKEFTLKDLDNAIAENNLDVDYCKVLREAKDLLVKHTDQGSLS